MYLLVLIFIYVALIKDHKSNTSTVSIPPMFEGETPTRQSQGICFGSYFLFIPTICVIYHHYQPRLLVVAGKNNNSTTKINNPDDLNIKRRGRPPKRVMGMFYKPKYT